MGNLNLYDSDCAFIEVSFDSGTTWYNLKGATAWEETEDAPEEEDITALGKDTATQVGDRTAQSVTIGLDEVQISNPIYNRLIQEADSESRSTLFRVRTPASEVRAETTASVDALALAATTGAGTFSGTAPFGGSNDATAKANFYASSLVVEGIWLKIGTAYYSLWEVTKTANKWWTTATVTNPPNIATADGTMRKIGKSAGSSAVAAGAYTLINPGVMRQPFQAQITVGGSIVLRTGSRAASSMTLAANKRFDMEPYFHTKKYTEGTGWEDV